MSEEKNNKDKKRTVISESDFSKKKLDIVEQEIYIDKVKKRSFPNWLIPVLLVVVIMAALIFFVPDLFSKILARQAANQVVELEESDSFLMEADAVFNRKSVALLEEPNLRANTLTSGLYNEPVNILSSELENGFYRIQLRDGIEGYVLAENLTFDLSSLTSDTIKNKVLLINREKAIASDTTGGNILATAPMGCILYADYVTDNVVRVITPGGGNGWMSRENLLVIQENEIIPQPETKQADIFCSSALMFINVAYVPGGMDIDGIDIPGIIYLAGKTNGLDLPRIMEDQARQGTQITFERAKDGFANTDAFKPGDLLFFSLENNPDQLSSCAIYLADGNILYASGNQSSVQVISFSNDEKLSENLTIVRRLFE